MACRLLASNLLVLEGCVSDVYCHESIEAEPRLVVLASALCSYFERIRASLESHPGSMSAIAGWSPV